MTNLTGKKILVTGASRGIGAATAKLCAQKGAFVVAHASQESASALAVVEDIQRFNSSGKIKFFYEDLSQSGAGERLFSRAILPFTGLDGVVNNAGIYEPTPLGDENAWAQGWSKTMAVNVQAPADICRAAINYFRKNSDEVDANTIINIASRAAQRGDGPDHAGYAASKGAIVAMTKSWARALSGEKIHFYLIAPGWVETRMAPIDIENRKKAVAEIPLGRVAQPEEIANLVGFILSGACPSAVGSTFDVNGASYVR